MKENLHTLLMATTSHQSLLHSPLPSVNRFPYGKNTVWSPSSVGLRQSGYVTSAAATCASVEAEFRTSSSSRCSTAVATSSYVSPASFYEILGIQKGSTIQEIKAAYRRLARVCHPDVAMIEQKESLADEFMKVNAAYCTLMDPKKRAQYDRSLFQRSRSVNCYPGSCVTSATSVRSSGFSGYTTRNWETDQCW